MTALATHGGRIRKRVMTARAIRFFGFVGRIGPTD